MPGVRVNMSGWDLPETATIGGTEYKLNTDYRDILGIMKYLNDPDAPEFLRWQIAIALFYEKNIPLEHQTEAMEYLASFISCGETDTKPGPILLDWDQDVLTIVAVTGYSHPSSISKSTVKDSVSIAIFSISRFSPL